MRSPNAGRELWPSAVTARGTRVRSAPPSRPACRPRSGGGLLECDVRRPAALQIRRCEVLGASAAPPQGTADRCSAEDSGQRHARCGAGRPCILAWHCSALVSQRRARSDRRFDAWSDTDLVRAFGSAGESSGRMPPRRAIRTPATRSSSTPARQAGRRTVPCNRAAAPSQRRRDRRQGDDHGPGEPPTLQRHGAGPQSEGRSRSRRRRERLRWLMLGQPVDQTLHATTLGTHLPALAGQGADGDLDPSQLKAGMRPRISECASRADAHRRRPTSRVDRRPRTWATTSLPTPIASPS